MPTFSIHSSTSSKVYSSQKPGEPFELRPLQNIPTRIPRNDDLVRMGGDERTGFFEKNIRPLSHITASII